MAKEYFLHVRVADWQKHYITTKAKKARMTESEFVRAAAMGKEITVIEGVNELLTELRRQGNNLNQLTVMARQGRIDMVDFKPFMEVYGQQPWTVLCCPELDPHIA
ncbi:plasmid mobilization protein [Dysosmobacter sp.]